jgi:hypothetical protein
MDKTPTEVLCIIMAKLAETKDRRNIIALKALRLCNHKLNGVSTRYLFAEIRLEYTEASHRKMLLLAQDPIFHLYVRKLSIVSKAIPGPLLLQPEFESWIKGTTPDTLDELESNEWECDIERSKMFDPHYFDDIYAEYVELYRRQGLFRKSAEVMLMIAASRFPHLEGLVSGTHRRFFNQNHLVTTLPCHKKHVALRWKATISRNVLELDQMSMVLRALESCCPKSGALIDASPILQGFGTWTVALLRGPEHSAIVRNSLANIVKFDLPFDTNHPGVVLTGPARTRLSLITRWMSRLEQISYTAYGIPRDWIPAISDYIGNNTWSNLTTLEIGRWYVQSSELSTMFQRHRSTLRFVSLMDIFMVHGSWEEVFAELQGGELRRLKLRHLGSAGKITLCDCDQVLEEDLPMSHPVYRYVFLNEPWIGMGYTEACLRFQELFQ